MITYTFIAFENKTNDRYIGRGCTYKPRDERDLWSQSRDRYLSDMIFKS